MMTDGFQAQCRRFACKTAGHPATQQAAHMGMPYHPLVVYDRSKIRPSNKAATRLPVHAAMTQVTLSRLPLLKQRATASSTGTGSGATALNPATLGHEPPPAPQLLSVTLTGRVLTEAQIKAGSYIPAAEVEAAQQALAGRWAGGACTAAYVSWLQQPVLMVEPSFAACCSLRPLPQRAHSCSCCKRNTASNAAPQRGGAGSGGYRAAAGGAAFGGTGFKRGGSGPAAAAPPLWQQAGCHAPHRRPAQAADGS